MASKLRDDEIKWVLNLDAKGVQGEIQKLSSKTVRLEESNNALSKSIKNYEKENIAIEKV